MFDSNKIEEIKENLYKLNNFIFNYEVTHMRLEILHGNKLIITGSFDFSYYHQIEIIFEEVSFLNIPTYWSCKKNWGETENSFLSQNPTINFEINDEEFNKNTCRQLGIDRDNNEILFTIRDDDEHNYYIAAKDIIINFEDLNYNKKEGFLYEFQIALKSENIGEYKMVKKTTIME